jgi:hypothetical protein
MGKQLFEFMIKRVHDVGSETGLKPPQALSLRADGWSITNVAAFPLLRELAPFDDESHD